jgi:hypothetical protein
VANYTAVISQEIRCWLLTAESVVQFSLTSSYMFRGIKRGYEAVFFSTIGVGISPDNKHTTNYPHLLITALETSDRTLSRLWLLRNVFLQQRE